MTKILLAVALAAIMAFSFTACGAAIDKEVNDAHSFNARISELMEQDNYTMVISSSANEKSPLGSMKSSSNATIRVTEDAMSMRATSKMSGMGMTMNMTAEFYSSDDNGSWVNIKASMSIKGAPGIPSVDTGWIAFDEEELAKLLGQQYIGIVGESMQMITIDEMLDGLDGEMFEFKKNKFVPMTLDFSDLDIEELLEEAFGPNWKSTLEMMGIDIEDLEEVLALLGMGGDGGFMPLPTIQFTKGKGDNIGGIIVSMKMSGAFESEEEGKVSYNMSMKMEVKDVGTTTIATPKSVADALAAA
jgi:carbon monoxide dehydrogenase subunit G